MGGMTQTVRVPPISQCCLRVPCNSPYVRMQPHMVCVNAVCQQEWGAAVGCCDEALACQPGGDAALKAWLRRSKANLGRHEYQVCALQL
jgi:hypothetical protein